MKGATGHYKAVVLDTIRRCVGCRTVVVSGAVRWWCQTPYGACGLEVGISKEFCIFVGYITSIVYKY